MTSLVSGDLTFMFVDVAGAKPFLDSGKVKALAVTTEKRSAFFPEMPTVGESGLKSFNTTLCLGLVVPAKTPDDIVATLSKSLTKMASDLQIKQQFSTIGLEPAFTTPKQFKVFMASDRAKWGEVIDRAGISLTD